MNSRGVDLDRHAAALGGVGRICGGWHTQAVNWVRAEVLNKLCAQLGCPSGSRWGCLGAGEVTGSLAREGQALLLLPDKVCRGQS